MPLETGLSRTVTQFSRGPQKLLGQCKRDGFWMTPINDRKVKRIAGLVTSEEDGRKVIYSLIVAKVTAGMLELSHPSG